MKATDNEIDAFLTEGAREAVQKRRRIAKCQVKASEFSASDLFVMHQALGLVCALNASKVLDDVMDLTGLAPKCKKLQKKVDSMKQGLVR